MDPQENPTIYDYDDLQKALRDLESNDSNVKLDLRRRERLRDEIRRCCQGRRSGDRIDVAPYHYSLLAFMIVYIPNLRLDVRVPYCAPKRRGCKSCGKSSCDCKKRKSRRGCKSCGKSKCGCNKKHKSRRGCKSCKKKNCDCDSSSSSSSSSSCSSSSSSSSSSCSSSSSSSSSDYCGCQSGNDYARRWADADRDVCRGCHKNRRH